MVLATKRQRIGLVASLATEDFDIEPPGKDIIEAPVNYEQGQGLNAGNELDGEVPEENQELVNEPFDPQEEASAAIVAMESQILDLQYLAQDLARTKGMSRSLAMEAIRILPDFGGVPINHYTELPSATRYNLAVEEISRGIWALIAAAAAAAIALIYKIYKWITGGKAEGGTEASTEIVLTETAAQADVIPEDLETLAADVNEIVKTFHSSNIELIDRNGNKFHCTSMQQFIDEFYGDKGAGGNAKRFLKNTDPILHDILSHGPYSKAVTELANSLRPVKSAIMERINGLDALVSEALNAATHKRQIVTDGMLKTLSMPIEITINNRKMSLHDAAIYIGGLKSTAEEKNNFPPIQFDHLYSTMAKCFKTGSARPVLLTLRDTFATMPDLEKRLEDLEGITRDVSYDGNSGSVPIRIGDDLRAVILNCAKDIHGLGMVSAAIKYYSSHIQYLAKQAAGMGTDLLIHLEHEMKKSKMEIPELFASHINVFKLHRQVIAKRWEVRVAELDEAAAKAAKAAKKR